MEVLAHLPFPLENKRRFPSLPFYDPPLPLYAEQFANRGQVSSLVGFTEGCKNQPSPLLSTQTHDSPVLGGTVPGIQPIIILEAQLVSPTTGPADVSQVFPNTAASSGFAEPLMAEIVHLSDDEDKGVEQVQQEPERLEEKQQTEPAHTQEVTQPSPSKPERREDDLVQEQEKEQEKDQEKELEQQTPNIKQEPEEQTEEDVEEKEQETEDQESTEAYTEVYTEEEPSEKQGHPEPVRRSARQRRTKSYSFHMSDFEYDEEWTDIPFRPKTTTSRKKRGMTDDLEIRRQRGREKYHKRKLDPEWREKQRLREKEKYDRIKSNPDEDEKRRLKKKEYYQKKKEIFKAKQRLRDEILKNDVELLEKKRQRRRELYAIKKEKIDRGELPPPPKRKQKRQTKGKGKGKGKAKKEEAEQSIEEQSRTEQRSDVKA